jgi:agmatinase
VPNDGLIMPYAGIPTFFNAPVIRPEEIKEGMTVVAGVPIDQGIIIASAGARHGPRAIREASLLERAIFDIAVDHTIVDIDTHIATKLKASLNLVDIGDYNVNPTDILKTTEAVIQGVSEVVKRGGFSVVLGGDHYIAYPSFEGFVRGMSERKPNPRLGYLHIDSHTDFRDQYGAIGGRYNHSTAARRVSENRAVSYRNMAWMGLNGRILDADMYRIYKTHRLKMLSARVIQERGPREVVREAMEAVASDTDAVYVTIDIDVVNGSEARGTGAAVFLGITAREFLEMMEALSEYDIIKAIDLCEVSPPLDSTGSTADLAVAGLLTLLISSMPSRWRCEGPGDRAPASLIREGAS